MPSLSRPVYHRPKALRASRLDSGRAAWGHEHVHYSRRCLWLRARDCPASVVYRRRAAAPVACKVYCPALYMVPCVSVLALK